jgi:hypothetical protein
MSASAQRQVKRPRNDATTSADDSDRPTKVAHVAPSNDGDEDATSSTMYAPLPVAMQLDTDHTKSHNANANARGSAVASAAAASSAAYIPSLISSLLPSASQFESNFNSKLKDKNLMLDNTVAGKTMLNVGDASAKLAKKRRKKRGIQMMSSNQRKAAGLSHIPRDNIKYVHKHRTVLWMGSRNCAMVTFLVFLTFRLVAASRCRYSMFLPLHQLWVSYMNDILDPQNSRSVTGSAIQSDCVSDAMRRDH